MPAAALVMMVSASPSRRSLNCWRSVTSSSPMSQTPVLVANVNVPFVAVWET